MQCTAWGSPSPLSLSGGFSNFCLHPNQNPGHRKNLFSLLSTRSITPKTHPLLAHSIVLLFKKMLPAVATVCCCHHSPPPLAAFPPWGSLKLALNQSHRTSTSRGGSLDARHGGPQVRFSLNDEQDSEPRSSEETFSSTSTPVGTVGETKDPIAPESAPPRGTRGSDSEGGGRFGDFSLLQTRRFWLGTSVGALAALGGNLGGLTSSIFNVNPQGSRSVRADLLFPVLGFKRCLETNQGFEFIYPMSWVGDQRLLYRAVERAERERSLDLPPVQRRQQSSSRGSSVDPVVAFGPPGTAGELNVSVVVAPVYPGFTLEKIGGPQEAGERILRQSIAPEGSKKVATLLSAQQKTTEEQLYYNLEYTVKGPTFFRHNLSVYTTRSGLLYSLNAQVSESDWASVQGDFLEIANSFKLLR